ncbi:MAG: peptidoglycan DD-metalloendopeptidase family protein [Gammaproteobacteria bacterium]|nr:peptidoglycan DD-metalloendopeptidase family protein [Gammaproteobacteria bacterium]
MILKDFLLKLVFCLLISSIFSNISNASDDKAQYQQKLDTIRNNINQVENTLDKDKSKRGKLQRDLKSLDKKIARLSKEIGYTKLLIQKYKKSLKILKRELISLEKSLKTQKDSLSRQVKAAYVMGKHETAKLLLNQQNAIEMGHAFVYYQYLNKTRSHQILEYNLLVQEKTDLKENITLKSAELTELKKNQFRQKTRFSANRSRRNKLIAQLNSKIVSNEDTLNSLQSHRKKIEKLLISLGELLADIPTKPSGDKPFSSLKGRLPWPISGRIINKYGAKKSRSDLKWNGVVLSKGYGTPVHAISRGRIIFSDWLQGYGFIIIIDHGSSFMSLYGYNRNLLKEPGDWVKAGEVIATVGDSGGQKKSGLYFEIRKQGKPVNPKKWCSIKYTNYASR